MKTLTFDPAEITALVADATAKWPQGVNTLYEEKTGPGFWLVGDHGVYLMHNGKRPEGEKPLVVFAKECNPNTMAFDDWWDAKHDSFGGDDGVEFLEPEAIIESLGNALKIRISESKIEILVGPKAKRLTPFAPAKAAS